MLVALEQQEGGSVLRFVIRHGRRLVAAVTVLGAAGAAHRRGQTVGAAAERKRTAKTVKQAHRKGYFEALSHHQMAGRGMGHRVPKGLVPLVAIAGILAGRHHYSPVNEVNRRFCKLDLSVQARARELRLAPRAPRSETHNSLLQSR